MYSHMYFEAKQKQDPDKLRLDGIAVDEVVYELMRKTGLRSYLVVDTPKTLEDYNHGGMFDILYIKPHTITDSKWFYEYLKICLEYITDNGYLLVDGMFPYWQEFGDKGYQAFVKMRQELPGYQFNMLWDCSKGLGIITKGEDQYAMYNIDDAWNLDWKGYLYFFKLCMNPVDTKTWLNTFENKKPEYKYSVLTCIFNNYEVIREIPNPRPDVEYVLVTDDPNLKSNVWKIILVDSFFKDMSGYAKAFYVKYHPWEFVESNAFIWIDGSIQILEDFTDDVMMPFINSNYELMELVNTITNQGDWELNRWCENEFHGFNKEQCDLAKKLFTGEPWHDETQVQTTIYAAKNTRLVNLVNNRTWDIMRCNAGHEHDIAILYMPQRGKMISKYMWNTHKVYYLDSGTLFSRYFDYCFHGTTESQREDWYSVGNYLKNDLWGEHENPIRPKKLNR